MTRRKMLGYGLLCTALGLALSMPNASAQPAKAAEPLKLGMVNAFFHDLPKVVIEIVTGPFGQLMKETTGLDGSLSIGEDAFGTAAQLNDGKLQFGVFHGHELAWVQKRYPHLKPLLVVVNKQHDVRGFVIIHKDNPAKTMADLRGKIIDVPAQTKEHCRVFLGKHCGDNAQNDPKVFFAKIARSDSFVDALDDVCKGNAQAAVVDTITLAFYKDIKGPCFAKNLRVLQQSDAFPPAVIVYKQGALPAATLSQFRDGLLKAHKNPVGADMMKMWSIDGFELPPENFSQMLADALRTYPPPAEATKVGMR
jgi:ABC-type phosphate/phosphonate transport system substrate-binding protein